jgi:protein-tyrosine phosphatase
MANKELKSILFVCLGNICRSPMAEGIFRLRLEQGGLGHAFHLDSAGTGAWHVGQPPDPRAQTAAARLGADLSPLRARQFQASDLQRFDLLLAMDRDNLQVMRRHQGADDRAHLMLPWLGFESPQDVPDPYYGDAEDFEQVARLLDGAAARFVEQIRQRHNAAMGIRQQR